MTMTDIPPPPGSSDNPAGETTPPPPVSSPPPAGSAPVDYASASTPGGYVGPAPDKDAMNMGMLAHLLGILGFLPPLIIWLVKKDAHPFIDDQSKESLNFQITLLIAWFAVAIVSCLTLGFGAVLVPIVIIANVILCIMAAMKAKEGIAYRYPFAIRLVK
jgi:uncharacterized Tic20 family protein